MVGKKKEKAGGGELAGNQCCSQPHESPHLRRLGSPGSIGLCARLLFPKVVVCPSPSGGERRSALPAGTVVHKHRQAPAKPSRFFLAAQNLGVSLFFLKVCVISGNFHMFVFFSKSVLSSGVSLADVKWCEDVSRKGWTTMWGGDYNWLPLGSPPLRQCKLQGECSRL